MKNARVPSSFWILTILFVIGAMVYGITTTKPFG